MYRIAHIIKQSGYLLLFLLVLSCTKKEDNVVIITGSPTPTTVDADNNNPLTSLVKKEISKAEIDSLANDSLSADYDCYQWEGQLHASSKVFNEEDNTEYELNILISLYHSSGNHYEGGMVIYVDEENFIESVVRGEADGNQITIYYVENEENTTGSIFKNDDKLVNYVLSGGEYAANWYRPMHRFVNETTVISLK